MFTSTQHGIVLPRTSHDLFDDCDTVPGKFPGNFSVELTEFLADMPVGRVKEVLVASDQEPYSTENR
jgi:hypothetical protein